MVSKAGLRDWSIQRITAVLIGLYTLFILGYLLHYQPLYFAQWQALFSTISMKAATVIVILSILWHAWIGLWTVFTDYVKPTAVRILLEIIVLLLLVGYFVWIIEILWGRI